MVDAVSSALFSRIAAYQQLARWPRLRAFRSELRTSLAAFVDTLGDRRSLHPDEREHFRRIGGALPELGLPLDAAADGLRLAVEVCGAFVREALSTFGEDPDAIDAALDSVLTIQRALTEATDALAAGHRAEFGRGTHRWARRRAEFVGAVVDARWPDESDAQREAEKVALEAGLPSALALFTHLEGRERSPLVSVAADLLAALPTALVGPVRASPVPHLPMLLPAPRHGVAEPDAAVLDEVVRAHHGVLTTSDEVRSWAAFPPLYRHSVDDLPVVAALSRSPGLASRADVVLWRMLGALPVEDRLRFVRALLGPVLDLRPDSSTVALTTLECFTRGRRPLKTMAAEAGLHPNSFRYRLDRVQAALSVDLSRGADLLRVELALLFHRLVRDELVAWEAGQDRPSGQKDGGKSVRTGRDRGKSDRRPIARTR